jgi:hypothetical protein
MVGLGRVELPTSPLSGVRSNQLSYRPVLERPLTLGARRPFQKNLIHASFGFEDKVERAGRLRRPGPSWDGIDQAKEGLYRAPASCRRQRPVAGLMEHLIRRSRFASGAVRLRGRIIVPSGSLLERR